MTPVLILGHGGLAGILLLSSRASEDVRARVVRGCGALGVLLALALVVFRASVDPWRAVGFEPGAAAIAGTAVACAWGMALARDLRADRWWIAALVGVASSALLLVAGAVWVAPALLFAGCSFAASALAFGRSNRVAWLMVAISDAALVTALAGHALETEAWEFPDLVTGAFMIPMGISLVLRAGAIPRLGAAVAAGPAAAVMAPLVTGSAFVLLVRVVDRPDAIAAGSLLLGACVVALVAARRKSLNPATLGAWPVLLGAGIACASDRAGVPAAVAAIIGLSAVLLWPDALERGRLSRGFVLSLIAPNVVFGATATAAAVAFAEATSVTDPVQAAAWVVTAALLPVALASGVALGVLIARSAQSGGYHPEAVFMTWMLVAGSVASGLLLRAGGIYEAIGGAPTVALFGVAISCGGIAAARARNRQLAPVEPLAAVILTAPIELRPWASVVALVLLGSTGSAIAWFTIEGLRIGFL